MSSRREDLFLWAPATIAIGLLGLSNGHASGGFLVLLGVALFAMRVRP